MGSYWSLQINQFPYFFWSKLIVYRWKWKAFIRTSYNMVVIIVGVSDYSGFGFGYVFCKRCSRSEVPWLLLTGKWLLMVRVVTWVLQKHFFPRQFPFSLTPQERRASAALNHGFGNKELWVRISDLKPIHCVASTSLLHLSVRLIN